MDLCGSPRFARMVPLEMIVDLRAQERAVVLGACAVVALLA